MSDFHPESWNTMWSVSTILTGLYSFMIENNPTLGSIETSTRKKRALAAQSLAWNVQHGDPSFLKLFPEYEERYEKERAEAAESSPIAVGTSSVTAENRMYAARGDVQGNFPQGLMATFAGIGAIIAILAAYRFF